MIESVTITNFLGETVECVLSNPFGHGLNITNITGLGPEEINLVTQDLALIDGSVYSSSRKSQRNIVITYKFIETPDIEIVRHRTYDLFGLGRWVRLIFKTDHRVLWIEGFVESNSPDIFSDGETDQVSIVCPDPWFRSSITDRSVMLDDGDLGTCGFEFETDYGREMVDRICFSERSYSATDHRYVAYNEGDRDVGFVLRFICKEETALSHAYITNVTTNEQMWLHCTNYRTYKPGEIYQVNTIPGYKMIYIYENQTDENGQFTGYKIIPTLNDIVRDFSWPTLQKGRNEIDISLNNSGSAGDFISVNNPVTDKFDIVLTHTPLYEGV